MPLTPGELAFLRQIEIWERNRHITPADPLTEAETLMMMERDSLRLRVNGETLARMPVLSAVDHEKYPLATFRPILNLISEEELAYLRARGVKAQTRGTRADLAFRYWYDLRSTVTYLFMARRGEVATVGVDAVAKMAVTLFVCTMLLYLAIAAFRLHLPLAAAIARRSMGGIRTTFYPEAVISFPTHPV